MRKKLVPLAVLLLSGVPTYSAAQQPAPPLTPAQKALLKESDAWWTKAQGLGSQQKWAEASAAAEKSLKLLRQVRGPLHPDVLDTWELLAKLYYNAEDFPAAENAFAEVVAIQEQRLGKNHWRTKGARAQLERTKRWAAMGKQNRRAWLEALPRYGPTVQDEEKLDEAAAAGQKVLALAIEIWGADHEEVGNALFALGRVWRRKGRQGQAETLYRRGHAIYVNVFGDDHPQTALILNELAMTVHLQGRPAEAETLDRKALAIRMSVANKSIEIAQSLNNLAADLRAQHQFAEAENVERQALAMNLDLHKELHPNVARTCSNLAVDLLKQRKPQEVEALLRKARAILVNLRDDDDNLLATIEQNLAVMLANQGKYDEADDLNRAALRRSAKLRGENNPLTASIYNNLASCKSEQGKFADAEELHRKALAIRLDVCGQAHVDTAKSCENLAVALREQGQYAKAEEIALKAATIFQTARVNVAFSGLDRAAFASENSPQGLLAGLLAHAGKPAKAWDAFEQDLGRGLFDDLSMHAARPLSEKERETDERLRGRLNEINQLMPNLLDGKRKDAGRAEKLRAERDGVILELRHLQVEFVKKYGVLRGEVYGQARIQKSLAADTAFIAWVDIARHPKSKNPAGDHWACVLRAKGDPVWVRLKGAEADGSWKQADDELPGKVLKAVRNSKDTAATDLLADLYQQRFEPLEPHLKAVDGLPPVKHLIVLPSSAMLGFPIEALTDRYLISYSPSATIYAYLRENRRDFGKACDLLALADPAFTEEQFQTVAVKGAAALAVRGLEKKRLPGTKGEVEAIAKLVAARGGKVVTLLGTAANGKNLDRLATEQRLKDFRYLHLATHGTPDAQGGMNSFLALASEDFKLLPYDKLTAGHILRTWKLDADLVTLSACETGLGQHQGGEGYVGFSQALFLAGQKGVGVRTLVMSQWQVNDLSTALLMERFYQNLLGRRKNAKEPMGKLAALTEARQYLRALSKEETLDQLKSLGLETDPRTNEPVTLTGRRPFAHPFYWAPFILVGDAGMAEK